MRPSFWNAPEPTTVSSAIWFHCSTVLPGGRAAEAVRPVPGAAAATSAAAATTATNAPPRNRFVYIDAPSLRRIASLVPNAIRRYGGRTQPPTVAAGEFGTVPAPTFGGLTAARSPARRTGGVRVNGEPG